jgi:hypothetical protein
MVRIELAQNSLERAHFAGIVAHGAFYLTNRTLPKSNLDLGLAVRAGLP